MHIPTKKLIEQSQKTYKALKSIKCPALGANIVFNRHGWNHVLYDTSDRRRSDLEVRLRLFLLSHVREVISNFKGIPVQEIRTIQISKKPAINGYFIVLAFPASASLAGFGRSLTSTREF